MGVVVVVVVLKLFTLFGEFFTELLLLFEEELEEVLLKFDDDIEIGCGGVVLAVVGVVVVIVGKEQVFEIFAFDLSAAD